MRLKEYIEKALQDIIEARIYITTNTIKVRRRKVGTDYKGNVFVGLQAEGQERPQPHQTNYFMDVNISAVTKIQWDLDAAHIDALFSDLSLAITEDLTPATLNTAITAIDATSGITILGINYLPEEDEPSDQYQEEIQRIRLALNFTS